MSKMQKVLGNLNRGMVFIVSAPAGTGKTTLVQMLENEFPCVVQSINFTTRSPRKNEVDGVHYNFVSKEEFKERLERGDLLEHAEIYGEFYGTSYEWIEKQRNQGRHVVLVIDTQGAAQLKDKYPSTSIFIQPPSLETLRERLTKRSTETSLAIEKRLEWAKKEIQAGNSYNYSIINDDLETAYDALRAIFIAEEHRINKQKLRRTHGQ